MNWIRFCIIILTVSYDAVIAQPLLKKEDFFFWHPDSILRPEHFKSTKARVDHVAYIGTFTYYEDIERSDTHNIRAYYSVMDMKRSWISPDAVKLGGAELEKILKHEKIHFDIQELYTRIYIETSSIKCQNLHKHNSCRGDIMGRCDFQQAKMNEQFDIDCRDRWWADVEEEWRLKLQVMLDSLDAYKDSRVYLKIAP